MEISKLTESASWPQEIPLTTHFYGRPVHLVFHYTSLPQTHPQRVLQSEAVALANLLVELAVSLYALPAHTPTTLSRHLEEGPSIRTIGSQRRVIRRSTAVGVVAYPVAHGRGLPREIAIEAVHAIEHLILELDHVSRDAEIQVGNIEISLGGWKRSGNCKFERRSISQLSGRPRDSTSVGQLFCSSASSMPSTMSTSPKVVFTRR